MQTAMEPMNVSHEALVPPNESQRIPSGPHYFVQGQVDYSSGEQDPQLQDHQFVTVNQRKFIALGALYVVVLVFCIVGAASSHTGWFSVTASVASVRSLSVSVGLGWKGVSVFGNDISYDDSIDLNSAGKYAMAACVLGLLFNFAATMVLLFLAHPANPRCTNNANRWRHGFIVIMLCSAFVGAMLVISSINFISKMRSVDLSPICAGQRSCSTSWSVSYAWVLVIIGVFMEIVAGVLATKWLRALQNQTGYNLAP